MLGATVLPASQGISGLGLRSGNSLRRVSSLRGMVPPAAQPLWAALGQRMTAPGPLDSPGDRTPHLSFCVVCSPSLSPCW